MHRAFISREVLSLMRDHSIPYAGVGRPSKWRSEAHRLACIMHDTIIAADDECWLWQGNVNSSGYGPHRIVYKLLCGSISSNLYVLHDCDVRRCLNPKHLKLGTQQQNLQEMHHKGRGRGCGYGGHPLAMSDPNMRQLLRDMHKLGIWDGHQLAALFNVGITTVSAVVHYNGAYRKDKGNYP